MSHPSGYLHDTGRLHPERPDRLRAVAAGVAAAGVGVEELESEPLAPEDLTVVHTPGYIEAIRRFCAAGGGSLDPDTRVSPESWPAALAAAGGGPAAVARLRSGFDGPALVGMRPPGHHALAAKAMGFCLFNNVAVTAARLRSEGERVAIVDWDVHHGNGTQEMFYHDAAVLYISLHQHPFYPYEGALAESGAGEGTGTTINIPLPALTAGDLYMEVFTEVVGRALTEFAPDWILVSSGFDAHANDPLAELRLVETDYAAMARLVGAHAPASRIVLFLEGGYDLAAIRDSTRAVIRALTGVPDQVDPSPHVSPPDVARAVARTRGLLEGRVVGLG